MSESQNAAALSPREQLLARRASRGDCTPVPAEDCPIAGVFVAKMSAGRYLKYLKAVEPFDDKPADDDDEKEWKAEQRLAVRLRFALVDADGCPLFRPEDDGLSTIDMEALAGVLGQFTTLNGMGDTSEKKSPPPSSSPGDSPSSAAAATSTAS